MLIKKYESRCNKTRQMEILHSLLALLFLIKKLYNQPILNQWFKYVSRLSALNNVTNT